MSEMDLYDSSDGYADDSEIAADRVPEAAEADTLEQLAEVRGHGDPLAGRALPDVDPADRADQERDVELDEDDYR